MTAEKPDLMEARRAKERDVLMDAYDFALASLGCSHSGGSIILLDPDEAQGRKAFAEAKLLETARLLAAAVVVDARLAPLPALDRLLGPHGRGSGGVS